MDFNSHVSIQKIINLQTCKTFCTHGNNSFVDFPDNRATERVT